ncbi:MAG: glycosyltransferase, partial [Chloroflexi bacterium]|nr:glycosyltransferase [Chloroflexota bacterium]
MAKKISIPQSLKILFLTQVLPYPLDAGPKIRAYYVLRHLAQKHAVTLVSFVRSSDTPQAIAHLKQFCERVITVPMPRSLWRDGLALLRSLLTGTPFLITRDWVPKMAFAIKNAIRHSPFAIVHADQLWMAPYAMGGQPSAVSGQQAKLVLDQHNAVHLIPKRMAADTHNPLKKLILNRETRLMARYESRICQQFDHVVWVTDEDRKVVTHHPSFATRHSPLATRHS